jgi:hypothetical protein
LLKINRVKNVDPLLLNVEGDGTNILTVALNVLSYGSVYQSGYVFSINDNYNDYPESVSVGGTVASLTVQAPPWPLGIIWSSNGSAQGSDACPAPDYRPCTAYDVVPGTNQTSIDPPDACTGNMDGACNTAAIVSFYSTINPTYYAAGLCKATIDGYSDWYLPSICEMGYIPTAPTVSSNCGTQAAPLMQNIQSNLLDTHLVSLIGLFWSSTEYYTDSDTTTDVWYQVFDSVGANSNQNFDNKGDPTGVFCVRAMT